MSATGLELLERSSTPAEVSAALRTFVDEFQHRQLTAIMVQLYPDEEDVAIAARGVISMLTNLAPKDEVERMICVQMIANNLVAMASVKDAAAADGLPSIMESLNRTARNSMKLTLLQTEALDKHRGRGTPQVTVERVNVEAGGQAVVGAVNTQAGLTHAMANRDAPMPAPAQEALETDKKGKRSTSAAPKRR
jgi:hypothetical protein